MKKFGVGIIERLYQPGNGSLNEIFPINFIFVYKFFFKPRPYVPKQVHIRLAELRGRLFSKNSKHFLGSGPVLGPVINSGKKTSPYENEGCKDDAYFLVLSPITGKHTPYYCRD